MKILLTDLWRLARERPAGFLDAVLEVSRLDAAGAGIEIEAGIFNRIVDRWPAGAARGFGDVDPKRPATPGSCC